MKLKQALVAALCGAGLMGMSVADATITFSFNPTGAGLGGGLIAGAGRLDESPGNDLALGGGSTGGGPIAPGTVIHDLYQANLNSVQTSLGANLFSNGTGGNFFTFVAGFDETVTSSFAGGGSVTNNFSINPGGFFNICRQSALGNDLAGTGFACAASDVILSGHMVSGNATQTGFPNALTALDNNGGNDYPGITTVTSSGGAQLNLVVDSVNAGYFPDLLIGGFITTSFTNTSLVTPFNQVDPSAQFSANGVTNGGTASNIGAINGITGPNFQFQADANSSFDRTIPEPGSLALLGAAVAGMAGFIRRRRPV